MQGYNDSDPDLSTLDKVTFFVAVRQSRWLDVGDRRNLHKQTFRCFPLVCCLEAPGARILLADTNNDIVLPAMSTLEVDVDLLLGKKKKKKGPAVMIAASLPRYLRPPDSKVPA